MQIFLKRIKIFTLLCMVLAIFLLFWIYKMFFVTNQKKSFPPEKIHENSQDSNYSIYENLTIGYKFIYPEGFQIKNLDNRVEVTSSSGRGKIIIQMVDDSPQTEIIADNLTKEESELLQNAQRMIKDTFEFIQKKYSEKELFERFRNSSPSGTMEN